MENEKPMASLKIHGIYRTPSIKTQLEAKGQRVVPAAPGVTYVVLTTGDNPIVFSITDTDRQQFTTAVPQEAHLVIEGFNHDGKIPSGVCATIRLMLAFQNLNIPRQRQSFACPCEYCTL